jgi:putative endopeptidase
MRWSPFFAVSVAFSMALFSQQSPSEPSHRLDTVDKSGDPCTDFYQYACGAWLKTAEIPPDQSRWGGFNELHERNLAVNREILEKASAQNLGRDAIDQKIGDYYSSCMDEKAVDAKGLQPLKLELERIAKATDKPALIEAIARAQLIGPNPLFNFYSSPDLHNADQVIAYIDQGGLSLPDRDYYIKDDPKMAEARKHLVEYVTQVFTLAGETPQKAGDAAQTVLRIETSLAKASMDRTLRRDPKNRDHKMKRDEAVGLAPDFSLNRFFTATGTPQFSELNVVNPEFFKQVDAVVTSEPLDAWKT